MPRPSQSVSRRAFVRRSLTALAATGPLGAILGVSACTSRPRAASPLWSTPALLEVIGAERVSRIGHAWMRMHANERSADALMAAITHLGAGNQPDAASIAAQVAEDFEQNRIVVVDGWMLGVTEARQCALYVISHG